LSQLLSVHRICFETSAEPGDCKTMMHCLWHRHCDGGEIRDFDQWIACHPPRQQTKYG
jgi:hypothetical protein